MKKVFKNVMLMMISLSLAAPAVLYSQEATEKAGDKSTAGLETRGQYLRQRFKSFRGRLVKLAKRLEKTDPKTAKILRNTIEKAGALNVEGDMQDVIDALKSGNLDTASEEQKEVIKNLQAILDVFNDKMVTDDPDVKEYERLKDLYDKTTKVKDKQDNLIKNNSAAMNKESIKKMGDELVKTLEDALDKQRKLEASTKIAAGNVNPKMSMLHKIRTNLVKLIDDQDKMCDSTIAAAEAISKLPVLALIQAEYPSRASALKTELAKAVSDKALIALAKAAKADLEHIKIASEKCEKAAGQMTNAVKSMELQRVAGAKSCQEQTLIFLNEALERIDIVLKKLAANTKTGKNAPGQQKLSDKIKDAAGNMKKLADMANIDPKKLKSSKGVKSSLSNVSKNMQKASNSMSRGNPKGAKTPQSNAIKDLEKQLKIAKELRGKAIAKSNRKPNPGKQKQITKKINEIAGEMKNNKGKPTPGQKNMQKAGKSSKSASQSMSKGDKKSASQSQQQTSKELEKAQDEIKQQMDKISDRIKRKRLKKIHEKLELILHIQQAQTEKTAETYKNRIKKSENQYEADDKLALESIAKREKRLVTDIDAILKLLEKDGSTAVFPDSLRDVRSDLNYIFDKLCKLEAGEMTQGKQRDVEETLRELINMVRNELSKDPGLKKRGGGGGGGKGKGKGKPKKQPLIPPIAELRMLRLKQLRIKRSTSRLIKQYKGNKITGKVLRENAKELGKRQGKVSKLAEQVRENMEKQQKKSGPPQPPSAPKPGDELV